MTKRKKNNKSIDVHLYTSAERCDISERDEMQEFEWEEFFIGK